MEEGSFRCRKCGNKISTSAKFCNNCGLRQKDSPSKVTPKTKTSPVIIALICFSLLLSVVGVVFGVINYMSLNDLKKTLFSKEYSDGEWYYYYELGNNGNDLLESADINRRSDQKYDSFEQCKDAFIHEIPSGIGGCAKNCEILPQSAYALRLYTCEDVVSFDKKQ